MAIGSCDASGSKSVARFDLSSRCAEPLPLVRAPYGLLSVERGGSPQRDIEGQGPISSWGGESIPSRVSGC